MKYFEEAKIIWQEFVPKTGQAKTVQGKLLREVEKLRDESQRIGNAIWDNGFKILIMYLNDHLLDTKIYTIEILEKTKKSLRRLKEYKDPYLEDDLLDELGDRIVEYFYFLGLCKIKLTRNCIDN